MPLHRNLLVLVGIAAMVWPAAVRGQETRVELNSQMVINEADVGDPSGLVDEQREIIGPPAGKPTVSWKINSKHNSTYPYSCYIDLGVEKNLSKLWLFDTHNVGDVVISVGRPGAWTKVATYDCRKYMAWASIPLDVRSRYVRLTRMSPGAIFTEIAIYEHTATSWAALQRRQQAEVQARAARASAVKRARAEALRRPIIELPPYGRLSLVDDVNCANDDGKHGFYESAPGASRVTTILNRRCRLLPPRSDSAAFFGYRLGRMKLLRPGGTYVLVVDYPEDVPRSTIVVNTGNETSRGFHTGATVGDALHAKYVNNLCESLDVPLSGNWEQWTQLFNLHDRFPEHGLVRGPKPRPLVPDDGFDVTIAQFSAPNAPLSHGAAVARIRLYEVVDVDQLAQPIRLPPAVLPHRHLFWREEMSDGVISGPTEQLRGVKDRLDWFRYKANLMHFLGMRTYCKDLLEFGACQHWNPEAHGGNDWVYYDAKTKDIWEQVVAHMGANGFEIVPYYEYSGSKGKNGLGAQRRCKPLTRDDAYTHTSWVENANADITDPDTYRDFEKMLDCTVLELRNKAKFAGVWLRTRSQMPVSFSAATRARFAHDLQLDGAVSRQQLSDDAVLYQRYLDWWHERRRAFLTAMRDYLDKGGIKQPTVLFTGTPSEPGVPFATWQPCVVTDQVDLWKRLVQRPENEVPHGPIQPVTVKQVVERQMYRTALLAPGLTWGGWEVQHAHPADDPARYHSTSGVLLTHAFNRLYTVAAPGTLDMYRGPSGLALIRHYALNENMIVDNHDQDMLGYFVTDFERAGPYCMMAEAVAVARGDPTMIGYLAGNNFGRGFPQYVRAFNANFLALPALPSRVVTDACTDPNIVVREIRTPQHGSWFAIINCGVKPVVDVPVRLPAGNALTNAVTGKPIARHDDIARISLYPYQLISWHLQ